MRNPDDENPNSEDIIAEAKSRISTPATMLFLVSLFLLGWIAFGLYISFFGPDINVMILEWFADQVPKGSPEHNQILNDLAKAKVRDRTFEYVQAAVVSVLNLIGTLLILFASKRMKELQSYTLCIVGAIFAIIPCSGCCVVSLPFGIWALAVLMNSKVKEGFTAQAKTTTTRSRDDDDDDRWRNRDRDDDTR